MTGTHVIKTSNPVTFQVQRITDLRLERPFGNSTAVDGSQISLRRVKEGASISGLTVHVLGSDGSNVSIASGRINVELEGKANGINFSSATEFYANQGTVSFPGAAIVVPGNDLNLLFTQFSPSC